MYHVASWVVTRQNYSSMGENALVVEIAYGGRDYANPGALRCGGYPGEFEVFTNPVDAAEAAIDIARDWRADLRKSGKPRPITIRHGSTGGSVVPFEPCTQRELLAWAKIVLVQLPKCAVCGDILEEERYQLIDSDDDCVCCSERCCEKVMVCEEE